MTQRRQLLACAVLLHLLAACTARDEVHRVQGHVFGTQVEISIYGPSEPEARKQGDAVLREFDRLHHKYHAWQPSQLTALNAAIARGEPFEADEEMVALLRSAADLSARSGDTFNPAIGRLIRLWGFQKNDISAGGPSTAEIGNLVKANPRMADLHFDGNRVSSSNRTVMLDLGGYAKGYALDRAAQILRQAHVKAALVNVGGNAIALGQPGSRPWMVGIRNPRGPEMVARVALHDNEAIGTSGDYERYFMKEGKRHAHVIDARTGQTVDLVASVTIITSGGSDAGLRSDGNSKPLFVVGPQGWCDMAQRLDLTEAMLIDAHGEVYATPAMMARTDQGKGNGKSVRGCTAARNG
ncbi:thiamine biosynthesis lipoprotein [Duganella sp. CF458]|uniref:FAD:protein FMN transferase n=1 Tax=Duganella sp. CF458 TaxID=1884368 RepID=UPI0008DF9439|nr:FAD:protein FMN transferase [Duganella sp. CF458]SFF52651.1 thiamine biosynthesis lipoprotein [Duganella sp. CF458]